MASINWSNDGGRNGQEKTAAAAEAFCNSNKHCYAWNDFGYWMMSPPASTHSFYAHADLCSYVKVGKKH
jgi:hypothetical protein